MVFSERWKWCLGGIGGERRKGVHVVHLDRDELHFCMRHELHIWMRKLGRGSRGCDVVCKITTKEVHDSRRRLWKGVSLQEQTTEVEVGEVLVGDYVTVQQKGEE